MVARYVTLKRVKREMLNFLQTVKQKDRKPSILARNYKVSNLPKIQSATCGTLDPVLWLVGRCKNGKAGSNP